MSDKTPNSTEELNGSEPSMDDILASIRKIISEDEPVALESPEDAAHSDFVNSKFGHAPNNFVSDAVADVELEKQANALKADAGSVDLNIDDVLAGLDEDLLSDEPVAMTGIESVEALGLSADSVAPEDFSLDDEFQSDEDILAFLDSEKLFDSGPGGAEGGDGLEAIEDFVLPSSQIESELVDFASPEKIVADDDADMDALLDDILMPSENDAVDFESNITPGDSALETATPDALEPEILSGDSLVSEADADLNLVKSLMADLTDDPEEFADDEVAAVDDLDSLLEIPELDATQNVIEERDAFAGSAEDARLETVGVTEDLLVAEEGQGAALETAFDPETDLEKDDILGDILGMTLEDELEGHPDDIDANLDALTSLDDVAVAEQENITENTADVDGLEVLLGETSAEPTVDLPSLSDIAAAAEADAVAVETGAMTQQITAAATTAAVGASAAILGAKITDQEKTPEAKDQDARKPDVLESHIATEIDTISDVAPFAQPSVIETTPETSQSLSNQETSMPVKAVKTDTILDEVTETATAGAFAELNSVVEDKAIFNERGPRIGDLVQEALRPMLKEWLDANLKGIVERAVTKEVKRMSSGK